MLVVGLTFDFVCIVLMLGWVFRNAFDGGLMRIWL